jgi:tRNA pseudouridine13 synthase
MGGRFKAAPEDFRVEEVPAYLPCGEGEHLFLWVEKRALSTPQVAGALAAGLGLGEREVSYAGLKDRQAVARQWFCVPARAEAALRRMDTPQIRVLERKRHRNKLRSGQLKGNRFQIRIRSPLDVGAGREALERLRWRGLANYFGPQRFGRERQNAATGRALLMGGPAAGLDRFQRKLFLSAFQSLLFNRALSARIEGSAFGIARAGDVMQRLATGGLFVCAEPAVDQPRLDSFEISPTGPLFGPKMMSAAGEVAEAEAQLLSCEGMTLADFSAGRRETRGGRRAYRLAVPDCEIAEAGPDAWLCFELPRGTYATALLREVLGVRGEPAEELEPL